MTTEKGILKGDITVTDAKTVKGLVKGKILVKPGGELGLKGICKKDLAIEENGKAEITGIVKGGIIVHSQAELKLTGVCRGDLKVAQNAVVEIRGIVKGQVYDAGGKISGTGIFNVVKPEEDNG